jgi:hypothetical protein
MYFRTSEKQSLLKVSIGTLKPNSSLEANNEHDTNHPYFSKFSKHPQKFYQKTLLNASNA